MNHPTREEWMAFLYGEHQAKNQMKTHLAGCDQCQAHVAHWKHAMKALDTWRLSAAPPIRSWQPVVTWAAAALVILAAGFGFGRTVSPSKMDPLKIRAAIESSLKTSLENELRQKFAKDFQEQWQGNIADLRARIAADYKNQLQEDLEKVTGATLTAANAETARLLAEFATSAAVKRTEEAQAIGTALKELESKRLNDYANLRKELETVAVLTELGLRNAQQDIVQLASFAQPNSSTPASQTGNK